MTQDERGALQTLGQLLLKHTVVLTRTDSPGRGSGVVVPWGHSLRVVTARHVISEGDWAIEAASSALPALRREGDLPAWPMQQRQTLLLRLKADVGSFDASSHDIAWATFDQAPQRLAADATAAGWTVPTYRGPLETNPTTTDLYTFVATNRDELHKDAGAMVREIAAEGFMTLLREERDGFRLALAREHQGDAYYRGSSGAPVADRTGAIVGIVSGGSADANELVVAGLAQFIVAMKLRT